MSDGRFVEVLQKRVSIEVFYLDSHEQFEWKLNIYKKSLKVSDPSILSKGCRYISPYIVFERMPAIGHESL